MFDQQIQRQLVCLYCGWSDELARQKELLREALEVIKGSYLWPAHLWDRSQALLPKLDAELENHNGKR